MPFGIIGQTGPGMRQVLGFGIGPRKGVLLGAHLGHVIVTNGDFTASVCDSASTVGAAVWSGACGGLRHCCISWGSMSCNGNGKFWGFYSHFHNWKCHWVADGEMFPIRMRKRDNVSVRQTYRWKARFVGFLAIYSVSRSTSGFIRNKQKSNDCSTTTQPHAATLRA